MVMPNYTAPFFSRPSLQRNHGLSSCFKGPHGSQSSEPTSVLDLATISPASSPGTSPNRFNPDIGAAPSSLYKSIIHKSYHKQNSSDKDEDSGRIPTQSLQGDHNSTAFLPNNSFIGSYASLNSCDGMSTGAQNEILEVLEGLHAELDTEFAAKTDRSSLEGLFTMPFSGNDHINAWDETDLDLLMEAQGSLSSVYDALSFNIEEGVAHINMYNSLDSPFSMVSPLHSPRDRALEEDYGSIKADSINSPHFFIGECDNLAEFTPLTNIESHSIVPQSPQSTTTDLHIQTLKKCMFLASPGEIQVYDTNPSGHSHDSEVQETLYSQFTTDEEIKGCTSSFREFRDSTTCTFLQSMSSDSPCTDTASMPAGKEFTISSIGQELKVLGQHPEEQGLQLVHLLLLCAEMVGEQQYDVVQPLLKSLQMMSSPNGNPLERISFYFSEVLLAKVAEISTMHITDILPLSTDIRPCTNPTTLAQMEIDRFYLALYQVLPYTKFLYFTANQAILEAVADSPQIHVVDFDIQQGIQWPNFFQSLAVRPRGAPKLIKLSAIGSCLSRLNQTGKMLAEFAQTLRLTFTFYPIVIQNVKELNIGMFATTRRVDMDNGTRSSVDIGLEHTSSDDEAIAVNFPAIMHSDIWEGVTTEVFLRLVKQLHPRVLTMMKAEKHNGTPSFVHKFIKVLFYYSAFFDSLEVALERRSTERARIEGVFLSNGLKNIISMGSMEELAMEASMEKWKELLKREGFFSTQFSNHALYQAKLLLGLYASEAFRIEGSHATSALSIGWKDTPLFSVLAFSSPSY